MDILDIVNNIASHLDNPKDWQSFALACKLFATSTRDTFVQESFIHKSGCCRVLKEKVTGFVISHKWYVCDGRLHVCLNATPYMNGEKHGTQVLLSAFIKQNDVFNPDYEVKYAVWMFGKQENIPPKYMPSSKFINRLKKRFLEYAEIDYETALETGHIVDEKDEQQDYSIHKTTDMYYDFDDDSDCETDSENPDGDSVYYDSGDEMDFD